MYEKKNRYDKIFIDVSNLYHRGYHVGKRIAETYEDSYNPISVGIVESIRMVQKIERDFLNMNGEVFFLFDNTHSGINKRKQIDPDYKNNREPKDEAFYRSIDYFHLILLNFKDNYRIVKIESYEADDLVKTLTEIYSDDSILLVSNDLDWMRIVSSEIHVAKYENKNYVIYKPEEFKERFGFEPSIEGICIYKSFRGDTGDNIPIGVKNLPSKVLNRLIEEFDSITDIIYNIKNLDYVSSNFKSKIIEAAPRLLINYKLVNYLDISKTELQENIINCSFNPNSLHPIYKMLELDIKNFDPRVYQFFPEKPKGIEDFFKLEKIPRA